MLSAIGLHPWFDARTTGVAAERIASLRRPAEDQEDIPYSVLGRLAVAAVMANEPAETVARLALGVLEGAPNLLAEAVDRPRFFYHACNALGVRGTLRRGADTTTGSGE